MADVIEQKEVVEKPQTRQSVIAAALEQAEVETTSAPAVPAAEEKKEEKKEEKSKIEPEALEGEALLLAQGKELILALRDPERAGPIIDFLAKHAGYSKAEVAKAATSEAKQETLTDDILDTMKAEMGEEFDVIAERVAKALKKILPKQLEKQNEDIRAEFQRQEVAKLETQSTAAFTKLTNQYFGEGEEAPAEVLDVISKYMDKYSPSPTMSVGEYVDDAFTYAVGKLGLKPADKAKTERTNKNRTDAASRLHASDRAPADDNLRKDAKPMTRQEAIRHAIEVAEKG